MNKEVIKNILQTLSENRYLFWSEADFQFAFAWELKRMYEDAEIRLEKRYPGDDANKYVDILVTLDKKTYPIELKYKTKTYEALDKDGETILLKEQSAQDIGRYSYLKDIERIEKFSKDESFERGFAIMLTNDEHYYAPNKHRSNTTDREFSIHEGSTFKAEIALNWHSTQDWVKKYGSITPHHDYVMHWENYRDAGDSNCAFKYVVTEISR